MTRSAKIASHLVRTPRLAIHLLSRGPEDGIPVILVHGNLSTSRFWEGTLASLPDQYRALAPDLRGFGDSDALPVDATRGMRDFAADIHSLADALGLNRHGRRIHLLGWSVGGAVVMQYAIDHPEEVASLVLVDPMSPYGFGGTRDTAGTPCWPDYAGSGAGTANPDFVKLLQAGGRGGESPNSPRNVMNNFYFKPPFRLDPDREATLLTGMLSTRVGEDHYPGDVVSSPNWPGVQPGHRGINNAISPKYCNLSLFASISPRPPVLWIRGADDQIVSDTSLFDFGFLGQIGAVPGWPGAEAYPPQPMVSQMRALLDAYREQGGTYEEVVIGNCGHSPHLEQPEALGAAILPFLAENSGR